jgi:large subunit ribosomal protein L18e
MITNQVVKTMAKDLKRASKDNDAPIWSKLSQQALKPTIARKTINLNKINKLTKDNDVIVFPGKILGTGTLSHKITLCSFSISNAAARKVLDADSKIINYKDMIKEYPTGKGVILLG